MKAIILAAGRGSRMGSITDTQPKCLTSLNGRTLLDYQLSAMIEGGVERIAVVTGYRSDVISDSRIDQFFHNEAWSKTNMVSSLLCADSWLSQAPCIVSYSDLFFDRSAISCLVEDSQAFTLLYDENWLSLWQQRFDNPLDDAETFRLNAGRVVEIGGKAQTTDEIEGQYMGVMKFTPSTWGLFKDTFFNLEDRVRASISMTEVIQKVIAQQGFLVSALAYNGAWGEVDSERDLQVYSQSK